jgi:hypothetical protein
MTEVIVDPDKIMWRGNKGYAVCPLCQSLVQINKRFFGSSHICVGAK